VLSLNAISFDQRGAAVLLDWLAVVRAPLPDWLYRQNLSIAGQ